VSIDQIESYIPSAKSVIRVMPNTPCCVSECAAAYAGGSCTSSEDKIICEQLFRAVGTCVEVPEKSMDAVTGLSGSGPACILYFISLYMLPIFYLTFILYLSRRIHVY
jgi:pyrroline-5-carboxylate reductase